MTDGNIQSPLARRLLIHREVIAVLLLSVAGVVAFVATRSLAASSTALRHADAAAWHAEGRRSLEQGDTARALDALRRAARLDRDNRDVSVSLAMALRAAGDNDQAASVLEALRSARPDDAEVNLQLARLASDRGELPAAIRYYQDALDALWPPSVADRSRAVRREFIGLLERHGERARALSQALVYAAELPQTPQAQLDAGRLLLDVGDPRRALDRYTEVLSVEPHNPDALAGAGEASFALEDYSSARRYLSQVPSPNEQIASLGRVANLVLSADPLAARISRAERERRLNEMLRHVAGRLDTCGDADSFRQQLNTLQASGPSATRRGKADAADASDRYESVIALAMQVEKGTTSCGPADEMGRAVSIIARQRGLAEGR